ncbi:Glutathione s-transferase [Lasiodiplodia theobromae]|uniref:Glutathione s-transferase n=1 Tax=Lasiodiplodia theobromae TaxID=45133 RepID=UPI0015C32C83|nr:Glutathione s-transferase [Lasiodiplodia theobromae]KAF4544126.1 Glutathione s-transferase [Lasiodiplodia theobromae]
MPLVVHHLQRSQSDRIVWLCEELGLPYELKIYQRDRKTLMAPPELKALHPAETAPIFQDGDLTLSESSAIMEYIMTKHGNGRFKLPPSSPNYADYVYWFGWSVGTLQSTIQTPMILQMAGVTESSNPVVQSMQNRVDRTLKAMDTRLRATPYLAGDEFTAADIYAAFTVSTMRLFVPFPLTGYDGILQWLQRLAERPAYKAMIEKGEKGEDRGVVPTIMPEAPTAMWTYLEK